MADKEKVYVVGHRNPDTDSICSAICYSRLKNRIDGGCYIPARAGGINEETRYVLERFGVPVPLLIDNITTQVKDIEIRKTTGVSRNLSIKRAWNMMQEKDLYTVPVVNEEGMLEGLITVGDIAKSYMNVYESQVLSRAETSYANIIDTLKGEVVAGQSSGNFSEGKVLIAAT